MMSCYSNACEWQSWNDQTHIINSVMIWARIHQYFKKCVFTIPRQTL